MTSTPSPLTVYPMRLEPGTELKAALQKFVADNHLKAAFVLTCCGSVTKATLRFAQDPLRKNNEVKTFDEHFEICSLVGTFSSAAGGGGCHLHTTLGRKDGTTVSGHVMGDMIVFTTAEVVLGECSGAEFIREDDERTQFDELVVKKRM